MYCSLLRALGSAVKSDENKSRPPRIEVSGDWGGGSHEDVRAVLDSCAKNLLRYSPERQLGTILVRPREGVPITLDQKGPHGEHQVLLSARGCLLVPVCLSVFARVVPHPKQLRSAEAGPEFVVRGALCETSSLFTMRRLAIDWKANPPYPNWRGFAPSFDQYVDALLAPRDRRLPPDRTLPQWFREHEETLVRQDGLTTDSKLVAVYLLPLSKTSRRVGKQLTWINLGPNDAEITFRGLSSRVESTRARAASRIRRQDPATVRRGITITAGAVHVSRDAVSGARSTTPRRNALRYRVAANGRSCAPLFPHEML